VSAYVPEPTDDTAVDGHEPLLQRLVERREYLLSLNQQYMWFECQLDPESCLYNLGIQMTVSGPLNVEIFLQAIQNTVDRHETLRTVFATCEDIPVQKVLSKVTIQCPIRELSHLLEAESRDEVSSRKIALAKDSFNLAVGPLFRTELLRYGKVKSYFLFAYHHLILDGFYCGQLMQEIASTYDRLCRGELPPPAPNFQYGDFCVWQRECLNRGSLAQSEAFWREQLREPWPELHLPAIRSAPVPRTVKSDVYVLVGSELVERLRAIGKRYHTTLFRVILATLTMFFSRLTESDELMFDIDFSTRPREMGHAIGYFANLLPVRFKVSVDESFDHLLRTVDLQLRKVTANRGFPIRRLSRKLRKNRDPIRPLSPVVVTQLGELDWTMGELRLTGGVYHPTATVHDLWLSLKEWRDAFGLVFGYSDDLFDRDRITQWSVWVKKLLEEVAARPEAPILQLSISSGMRQDVL
jgi:NRPS condensation-like uncharacterized protein